MNGIKNALVVEGGGMRGVYSAGVLAAFAGASFDPFDLYIGVSAGACKLASHLAGQHERNIDILMRWSSTRRFISYTRFLAGGHLMDLDWLWDTTIREYRLDLKRLFGLLTVRRKEFVVVATSMKTGSAMYLRPDETTLEHYLKVSSSIPILYRGELSADGERSTDGGVADSIPVRYAHRCGASHITVIRSRPSGYEKRSGNGIIGGIVFRKYPRFAGALNNRADDYMRSVEFIRNPPTGVQIVEVAPPANLGVSRTTRDRKALMNAYRVGMEYGQEHIRHCTSTMEVI